MFSKIRRPPKTSQNRVSTCVYNYGSTVPRPFWGIFFRVETVKNLPSAAGCAATSQCAGKRRANRHIRLRGWWSFPSCTVPGTYVYIYNINVCIYIYIQYIYIYIHTIYIYGCIEKRDYQFVWQFEKNCDLPIIARAVEEQVCRRPLWKIKTLVSGEEKALQVWTLPALRTWLCGDHTLMCHFYVIAMAIKTTCYIPSGKHTKSYWKWPFIVDFPINSMVIFHSYVKLPEGTIYVCK